LATIESGSREASRRSRALADQFDSDPPAALADRPRALPVVEGEPLEAKIVGYQSHKKVCLRPAGEKEEAHPDASSRHIADIVDAFAE
jgi:hypothetical protein